MVVPLPGVAMTSAGGPVPFLFGKLPSHGDFVSRGLAATQRDRLDAWLSAGLAEANRRFGVDFDDLYDRAPPWRFLAPDPDSGMAGALALSIDQAGRRYPIYLGVEGLAVNALEGAGLWCEEALYRAIAERWDTDSLLRHAAGFVAAPVPAVSLPASPRWWSDGNAGFAPGAAEGLHPPDLLSMMLQPKEDA